jgi:cytochrome c2
MKTLFYLISILVFVVGCTPQTTEILIDKPVMEVTPMDDVSEGSQLFETNCVRCHKLKNPSDYSAEEWKEIVPRMAVKAKIDSYTENKILEYVMANAKQ